MFHFYFWSGGWGRVLVIQQCVVLHCFLPFSDILRASSFLPWTLFFIFFFIFLPPLFAWVVLMMVSQSVGRSSLYCHWGRMGRKEFLHLWSREFRWKIWTVFHIAVSGVCTLHFQVRKQYVVDRAACDSALYLQPSCQPRRCAFWSLIYTSPRLTCIWDCFRLES